jgi:uncharacterized protein (DUF1778 family)
MRMTLSIRLPAEDEMLLERAAAALHISKSEFIGAVSRRMPAR